MKKFELASLIIIVALAFFLRFFMLTRVPISLNWDEASFAYNSYSILETGKDEYGVSFPLIFKSVGDYKNPLLVYLMVPSIKIFGLNELGVRFPTALIASFTILLLFLVVKQLFDSTRVALLSSLALSISPWHLQFSRAGLELPISLFLVLLGVYCFILGVKGKGHFFLLSAISFAVTLYSYYADRFFVPLIVIVLLGVFRKEVFGGGKKIIILSAVVGTLLLLPLLIPFFSSGSQQKIITTTLFGYQPPQEYITQTKKEDISALVYGLFHNPVVEYGWMVADRYANHFSPSFLFLQGSDDNRQLVYDMGVMYLFDLPFLLFGAYVLVRRKDKFSKFLLFWLLIAPLPAAITRSEVHPRRAFEMVIPLTILIGFGADYVLQKLSKFKLKTRAVISGGILVAVLCFFAFYLLSYYVFTPLRTFKGSGGWQYGYKELVSYISPIKGNYNQVVVDTSYQGPYIFFLFYEKYPPVLYQPQAKLVLTCPDCLGEGPGFDNYVFRPIYWPADRGLKKTLFAGPPERIPEKDIIEGKAKILQKIYFPDGQVAFLVVETI